MLMFVVVNGPGERANKTRVWILELLSVKLDGEDR